MGYPIPRGPVSGAGAGPGLSYGPLYAPIDSAAKFFPGGPLGGIPANDILKRNLKWFIRLHPYIRGAMLAKDLYDFFRYHNPNPDLTGWTHSCGPRPGRLFGFQFIAGTPLCIGTGYGLPYTGPNPQGIIRVGQVNIFGNWVGAVMEGWTRTGAANPNPVFQPSIDYKTLSPVIPPWKNPWELPIKQPVPNFQPAPWETTPYWPNPFDDPSPIPMTPPRIAPGTVPTPTPRREPERRPDRRPQPDPVRPPQPEPPPVPTPDPGPGPSPKPKPKPEPKPDPVPKTPDPQRRPLRQPRKPPKKREQPSQRQERAPEASPFVRFVGAPRSWPRPPRKHQKEVKLRARAAMGLAWGIFNAVTEGRDFLREIYKALPKRFKTVPRRCHGIGKAQQCTGPTVQQMFKDIYRGTNGMKDSELPDFWNKAIDNVVANQIGDYFAGKTGKAVGQASAYHNRPIGFTAGPGL